MSDIAIKVDKLSKKYSLGQVHSDLLTERIGNGLRGLFKRRASKERKDLKDSSLSAPGSKPADFWALKDVSFEVKQGEVVGIIGRNGAGKSTLLKVLSRITEPTEGQVVLYGRVGSLLEVGTGFHPELTGRENIFLNGAILGMKKAEINKKFDDIVAFAEVEKFIDTPVKRYSSGMYVRLAFAVAAHLEPEILIIDEVLAVGDAAFQKKCLGKMEEVGKEGRTVLFVSHNMSAVTKLCSRCIYLEDGHVGYNGAVDGAVSRYIKQLSDSDNILKSKNITAKVMLFSENGSPLTVWNYNETIIMNLHVSFNDIITDPTVHLVFYAENGATLFSYQTEYNENLTSRLSGITMRECDFVFSIKNTGLRCNTISVDIGIAVNKEPQLIGLWQSFETIPISLKQLDTHSIRNCLFYLPTGLDIINIK